ncbi:hypothetical protein E3Q19_03101, partial [Wallemia mellicola]
LRRLYFKEIRTHLYITIVIYSDRYSDDFFEYRHVILPKQVLRLLPRSYFEADDSGVLRILSENEWRGMGITQSLGWEMYATHAPEPHILLFRREKDYQEKVCCPSCILLRLNSSVWCPWETSRHEIKIKKVRQYCKEINQISINLNFSTFPFR